MNEDVAAPEDAVALETMAALAAPAVDVVETPEAFLTGVAAGPVSNFVREVI